MSKFKVRNKIEITRDKKPSITVANSFALKLILILIVFVIILTLLSDYYLNNNHHGNNSNKKRRTFLVYPDEITTSISVKNYLDNYFNQKLLNDTELIDLAEQDTNIALKYIIEWHKNYWSSVDTKWPSTNVKTCEAAPPHIQTIHMNNIYWQTIVSNEDLNLYSYNAYYDNRQTLNKIRILGVSDHFNKLNKTSLWCLLYFEGKKRSVLTQVTQINELAYDFGNFYKRKGYYLPVLLTCDVPKEVRDVPKAVAIKTEDMCSEKLNNFLRIIYNKPENNVQEQFGVCVRSLYYYSQDFSLRLLEWLEMIKILGAHKVFLYSFSLHKNMEKVLNYYISKNFVDWKHSTHSGKQLNEKYLDEIYIRRMGDFLLPQQTLELNDCLYKNLYKYEYLALLDIDELIVPVHAYNWQDLLKQIHVIVHSSYSYLTLLISFKFPRWVMSGKRKNNSITNPDKKRFGSYIFSETRFYNDLESNELTSNRLLFMMRHLYRGNFTNKAPKSFHLTKNIKVTWNHSALKCITNTTKDDCSLHWVKKDIGYLFHFRPGIDGPKNCNAQNVRSCATFDPILAKYKNTLEANMKNVLNEIFG